MILITFYSNDGTDRTETQAATKGGQVTLNANTWTRNGYWFLGWSSQSGDSDNVERPQGQTFTAGQSDMNLYAVWLALPSDTPVTINSVEDFTAFMRALPANTKDSPQPIVLNLNPVPVPDEQFVLFRPTSDGTKFVSLDLSGSTFNNNTIAAVPWSDGGVSGHRPYFGQSLVGITIPASVTSIGQLGLPSSNLTSITFLTAGITLTDVFGTDGDYDNDNGGTSLKTAFASGGAGTYTRTGTTTYPSDPYIWTKQ